MVIFTRTQIVAPALALLLLHLAAFPGASETALDRYVAQADAAYRFKLVRSYPNIDHTLHVIDMVSQTWLSPAEVDRTEWQHWLTIVVPRGIASSTALLFIGGGNNNDAAPLTVDSRLLSAANAARAAVAELHMVPNQPLTFKGEAKGRTEDALVAYAWDKYLRGGDPKWLPRLPMTKAAVRAMDTVAAFMKSKEGGGHTIDKFVVAGASKRGWTTWTTAAVDKRVVAIVPMVIDLLNLEPSMTHHYRSYGRWAPAIQDYERMGIMKWLGTPQFRSLLETVEPYAYRDRYTMPKLIVNASGDEFFLPDSSQFYFDQLPQEKYLYYVPNTSHSLNQNSAFESLVSFFQSILNGTPRPQFSWTLPKEGGIFLKVTDKPAEVSLWQATNPNARDFRKDTLGLAYQSTPLTEQGEGVYKAVVAPPKQGWTAYFVELVFPGNGRYPFRFSTPVRVTPEKLPYPAPKSGQRVQTP
jgi:PhoPQ-activated pathogenicity-related protein